MVVFVFIGDLFVVVFVFKGDLALIMPFFDFLSYLFIIDTQNFSEFPGLLGETLNYHFFL